MEWYYVYLVVTLLGTTIGCEGPAWDMDDPEIACEKRCDSNDKQPYLGLGFRSNETSGILILSNQTAPVALAVDLNNDIILAWNGTTGWTIVTDYRNDRAIVVTPDETSLVWPRGSRSDPDGYYLRTTPSLSIYFNVTNGTVYKLSQLPDSTLDQINAIAEHYVGGEPVSGRDGVDNIIQLTKIVTKVLNGPLKGIISFLDRKKIRGTGVHWTQTLEVVGRIADNDFYNPPSD